MYVCMYVCMYVYMFVHMYTHALVAYVFIRGSSKAP